MTIIDHRIWLGVFNGLLLVHFVVFRHFDLGQYDHIGLFHQDPHANIS